MTAVIHLRPGDLVTSRGEEAVYITQTRHPLLPQLQLILWHLDNGEWFVSALAPTQDVGTVAPATGKEREKRLRQALTERAFADG